MEVIPAIDLMKGKVVRLVQGDPRRAKVYEHFGDPVNVARNWQTQGAISAHIIDLDATLGTGRNYDSISKIAHAVNLALQVGGGIRNLETARDLLTTGISRVILGTLAFEKPSAVTELCGKFGEDRVIVALDCRDGEVMVDGWKASVGFGLEKDLSRFLDLGIKTFLVTSIAADGTLSGPDLSMLARACAYPDARIIAAGGIGSINDLIALKGIGAKGAVVGKALYEGAFTLKEALRAVREGDR
jgi:phosphoribosylformimino-5-aminoimidazole carboxamide ribotide isomerase